MADHEIQALVKAHWNEFMVEEIILAQRDDLEREADEIGQLQLVIHKLERAKLEVAYYSDAVSNTMKAVRRPVAGESGSPTMNEIFISHQVGVVMVPITTKTCPLKVRRSVPDNDTPCRQGR
jgi:hypothetical protein